MTREQVEKALQILEIITDIKHRHEPKGLNKFEPFYSEDEQLSILGDLIRHKDSLVRERSWSVMNAPLSLSEGEALPYIFALLDLVIVEGRAGHLKVASDLASAATKLAQLPNADPEGLYRQACLIQDLGHWLNEFGLADTSPRPAYHPLPDTLMPLATTEVEQAKLGLGPDAGRAIAGYLELCKRTGADECIILFRGHIVLEWYSDRFFGEPVDICSSTKSITGLVAAIADGDGRLKRDRPVSTYLRSWRGGLRDQVLVQDVLDMTAGIASDSEIPDAANQGTDDLDKFAESQKPRHPRGKWAYSSLDVQLMDPILREVIGMPVSQFARNRIFDPLGIPRDSGFVTDSLGNTILMRGAKFRARELARIGQMLLNHGSWQGTQIVPESWIQETAFDTFPGVGIVSGFGNLFYIENDESFRPKTDQTHSIGMKGAASNDCTIFPEQQMVVVRLQKHLWSWADLDYPDKERSALKNLALAMGGAKVSTAKSGPMNSRRQFLKMVASDPNLSPPPALGVPGTERSVSPEERGRTGLRAIALATVWRGGLRSALEKVRSEAPACLTMPQSKAKPNKIAYAKTQILRTLASDAVGMQSIAFSPDGTTLAAGGPDFIACWDVKSWACTRKLINRDDSYWVHAIAFSPNGLTLASGSGDDTLMLWNVRSSEPPKSFTHRKGYGWVESVAFSPDGSTLAGGSSDSTVKLWDASSGKLLRTLKGHSDDPSSIAFSPDGSMIVSGSADDTIKLWDAKSGELKMTLPAQSDSGWVHSVAFSTDGMTIASGSSDDKVRLWDARTGALRKTLISHSGAVYSIAFSPNGSTFASGSADDTIKLWDARTGALIKTLAGHTGAVTSVAFSPGGSTLASASEDDTIKLWRVPQAR